MISGAARIGPGWALGVLSLLAPCAPAASLQRAELQQVGAVTTLTLQFDSKPQARVFMLNQPQRAVVDLKGFRSGPGLRLPEGAGVVSTVRSGPLASGRGLRLVLELDARVQAPRQRYLAPAASQGHRLLIELATTFTR